MILLHKITEQPYSFFNESPVFGVNTNVPVFVVAVVLNCSSQKIWKFPHARFFGPINDFSVIRNGSEHEYNSIFGGIEFTTFHNELNRIRTKLHQYRLYSR